MNYLSVKTLNKISEDANNKRYNKKDWVSKTLEKISSKTVLQHINNAENIIKTMENYLAGNELIKRYEEILGYYFLAYYRSGGNDKKVIENITDYTIKYHNQIVDAVNKNIDNIIAYEKDSENLNSLINILDEDNVAEDKNYKEKFLKNLDNYSLYKEMLSLKTIDNKKLGLLIKDKSKFALILNKKLNGLYKQYVEKLYSIIENEEMLINIEKSKINGMLHFISYFSKNKSEFFKEAINSYFKLKIIKNYFENDMEFSDIRQIKNYLEYLNSLSNKKLSGSNLEQKAIIEKALISYNKDFINYNLDKFYLNDQLEEIFIVEKFLNRSLLIDNKFINNLNNLDLYEKIDKVNEIIDYFKAYPIKEKDLINNYLKAKNKDLINSIESVDRFLLNIIDEETDNRIIAVNKNRVFLGRDESNDIEFNNSYISRSHLIFDLNEEKIFNANKDLNAKIYVNNDGLNNIVEKSFYEIKELNIANILTFDFDYNNDLLRLKLNEKTSDNHKCFDELLISEIKNTDYYLLKNLGKLKIIEDDNELIIYFDLGQLWIIYKDKIKILKNGKNRYFDKFTIFMKKMEV